MNRWMILLTFAMSVIWAQNQTEDVSPILSPEPLPYRISISLADFQLPSNEVESTGLQAFVYAISGSKWLLLSGRTSSAHGFDSGDNNFPPLEQNTTVYVVDSDAKTVRTRSLTDPSSGLSQGVIDTISVTNPQYFQAGNTLYLVGGYGVETATGQFSTKSTLTAIDVKGLISWVEGGKNSAAASIRQTTHPLIQVTGGFLTQTSPHQPYLLVFGQTFTGFYTGAPSPSYTQTYTEQIRTFSIIDNGTDLYVKPGKQFNPNPNYRRRDLSVVPIMKKSGSTYIPSVVALSGVFTPETGIWTVPVEINGDGSSSMSDPSNPDTFKQGMNSYDCARTVLFSKSRNEMYILLFGGISYLYSSMGMILADAEIPYINNVTTVKIDSEGNYSQYLMEDEYPVIASQFANPGNTLLFGAEARFIPSTNLPAFPNHVFSFDELGSSPVLIGHIVGGIQSSVPNTIARLETGASPYIFSVYLERR